MKLLVFSPYYPPHIGGLEYYAEDLNKHLSQKGVSITVFTTKLPRDTNKFEILHNNIKVFRFPAFEIISNYPLPKFWSIEFWQLFLKLFKQDFDITISHTRFFSTSLMAIIYAKIKNNKWVHIEHGSDFVQSNSRIIYFLAKTFDLIIGKFILNSADQNIAISHSVKNFIKNIAPNAKCTVIHRGFDAEKLVDIKPNYKTKKQYANNKIILYIGRLISGKGVSDLLKSFAKLKDDQAKLFIIGDGPEKKNLKILANKLNIANRTIFFGHKQPEETIQILKIADIFVNPSYSEGLPTTIIEAALCSKPIIATNVGGTNEIITNTKSGRLINSGSISELTSILDELIASERLRTNYGNCAFQEVKNKFNWDNSIKQYLNLFKELK